ncbi:MAG: hypothetical protein ACI85V_001317 [bacterium]|jgi:hypothetical protein
MSRQIAFNIQMYLRVRIVGDDMSKLDATSTARHIGTARGALRDLLLWLEDGG